MRARRALIRNATDRRPLGPREKASQAVFAGICWFECPLFARQGCIAFEIETDISEYG